MAHVLLLLVSVRISEKERKAGRIVLKG